ncbi:MAG: transaldolase [Longimicrobiales bacterium]
MRDVTLTHATESRGAATDRSVEHTVLVEPSRLLSVALYLDGANLEDIERAMRQGVVEGFTTNPTLARKAGVRDYRAFAHEAIARVGDLPVSIEVLADDFERMAAQAREIARWGENVLVKVPICTTRGESTIPLIRELCAEGLRINVTAVLTLRQVRAVSEAVQPDVPAIVSLFGGRIADTGVDPCPVMAAAVELCRDVPELRVLWGSPREILNVYQADACGVDVIVLTADLLAKLSLRGKDLEEFSRETVQMFVEDGVRAGYTL